MSEQPSELLPRPPSQFDLFPPVQNANELAARVREADSVSTVGLAYRTWSPPSRLYLLSRLESLEGAREQAQFNESRLEQVSRFDEAVALVREQLATFPTSDRKPYLLRFGKAFSKYQDFPEDQVAVLGSECPCRGPASSSEARNGSSGLPFQAKKPSDGFHLFLSGAAGSIRSAIDFNLPHPFEPQCGSWRDWILGMKIMLADGTLVNTGSRAVKNVAGYDLHKLMVGARGTLGIILEVTVRTFPMDTIRKPDIEVRYERGSLEHLGELKKHLWVQRTKATDFLAAVRGGGAAILEIDWSTSTLWATVPPDRELQRFEGDWVLRSGCGEKNMQLADPTQIALMRRAKDLFDPTHKLNPGEMGIF